MKTIRDKANLLGYYELIFGDYRRLFTQVDLINKVTREDLQRVARQYFPDRNRTAAVLIPDGICWNEVEEFVEAETQ